MTQWTAQLSRLIIKPVRRICERAAEELVKPFLKLSLTGRQAEGKNIYEIERRKVLLEMSQTERVGR